MRYETSHGPGPTTPTTPARAPSSFSHLPHRVDEAAEVAAVVRRKGGVAAAEDPEDQGLHVAGLKRVLERRQLVQDAAWARPPRGWVTQRGAGKRKEGVGAASPSDQTSDLLLYGRFSQISGER